MLYSVHQFQTEGHIANGNWIDQDVAKAHADATILGEVSSDVFDTHYRKVALVDAKDLDEVFEIGNIRHHEMTYLDKAHSISVGDVIVDTLTREHWIVASCGFEKLEVGA